VVGLLGVLSEAKRRGLVVAGKPTLDALTGKIMSRAVIWITKLSVDLLVINQSHTPWIEAFQATGYRPASSNYIPALSKQLAAEMAEQQGGFKRMHFTRGDRGAHHQ
jgi:hypothetical protein